ncbi:MAG: hypothetical protein JW971_09930 [Synergistales bacterium]|nr:hypothetical protein [Synergistales bacterium]
MDQGRIKQIKTVVIEMPFRKTWQISLYAAKTRPHLLVMVETEEGIRGYGEASPSLAFMGETAYTDQEVIERNFKEQLKGISVLHIAEIHRRMDRIAADCHGAKTALDLAIYDTAGQLLQIPVYSLLGGKVRDSVRQAWVLGIQNIEEGLSEGRSSIEKGYGTLKVKVGTDPAREKLLLARLRDELGYTFKLRIDANQAFTASEALSFYDGISHLELEYVEQPVKRWDLKGLKFVRDRIDVPVMADESCAGIHDAIRIIDMEAADILNIKVAKVGGLYRALQTAAIAEAAGLTAVAGSNIEAGLGSMANVHFTASQVCMCHDNDQIAVPLYEEDILDLPLSVILGEVPLPDKPGFGVILHRKYLDLF